MVGFPKGVLTQAKGRVQTETQSSIEKGIFDGIGFTCKWRESNIPQNDSRWAYFTVPSGYYLELYFRLINPDSEDFICRVYPDDAFTLGPDETDDATSFAITRNLRQGASLSFPDTVKRVDMDDVSATKPGATDFLVFEDAFGEAGTGQRTQGDLTPDDNFLLLSPNQTFLLEMFNGNNAAAVASITLSWGFIPEDRVPDEDIT